jgi:hypothetical protein
MVCACLNRMSFRDTMTWSGVCSSLGMRTYIHTCHHAYIHKRKQTNKHTHTHTHTHTHEHTYRARSKMCVMHAITNGCDLTTSTRSRWKRECVACGMPLLWLAVTGVWLIQYCRNEKESTGVGRHGWWQTSGFLLPVARRVCGGPACDLQFGS